MKQGSAREGGYRKWFAWSAVAVGVLALAALKALGIVVAVVLLQPEVSMEIIKSLFTYKVALAASVETAWSIFVNLLTSSRSASADDALMSMG
ncbi:hypothetical protein ACQKGO_04000 [Corallococcus interemptor]|uniref:hypothetical protein n=1 Tax=Corallococcus interemptor TaxID=2316720 RepID=UPI003CFD9343